jgi:hypothetical protein
MIGGWKYTAVTLVLLAGLSGLGLCCAGLLSAPDQILISLVICFAVSLWGTFGLVVCCYVRLNHHVRNYLDRSPLTDKDFAASLACGVPIDLTVVQETRQIAARRFGSLAGKCFYPGDRLEADLHLSDLAPWALEDFWLDLEETFGDGQDDTVPREIVTFGDVVLEANRRRRGRTIP